jgi:dolichol kinase
LLAFAAFVALVLEWRYRYKGEQGRIFREVVKDIRLLPEEMRGKILEAAEKQGEIEEELMQRFMEKSGVRESDMEEEQPFLPSFTYILGVLFATIFFGPEIAILGVVALSVGDSVATMVGKAVGQVSLPYNEGKSLEGSLGFVLSVFLALLAGFVWLPTYALFGGWETALTVAVAGAVAETLPTVEDNFAVPFVVGVVVMLVLWFM